MCLLAVARATLCICGMEKASRRACRPKCMLLLRGSELHRERTVVSLRDLTECCIPTQPGCIICDLHSQMFSTL